MNLPLISHPSNGETLEKYPEDQLTAEGDLRLSAHNATVADRALRLFDPTDDPQRYLRVAAALHDFGKATPQFQAHVRGTYDGPDEEKAHARLGAVATWYVLGALNAPPCDRLAATLAVARHHQALPNAAQYTAETLARALDGSENTVLTQVKAIDDSWSAAATELLQLSGVTDVNWEGFTDWIETGDVAAELKEYSARQTLGGSTPSSGKFPEGLYDRTLHYWSAITLADKSHAMAIPEEQVFDLATLDRETIEEYIADIRSHPPKSELEASLNDERERARRQTIRGVHEWTDEAESIATLTLPTGLGKTFTGLSAAFEARDILSQRADNRDEHPRPIVYALPYTSIIEQTRAIFEDPDLWGADPKKSALTVHHYLSETVVYSDEYEDTDVDDTDAEEFARLLGESWRDGTILTTFVQLFESLTGPSNRQGLKLPSLDSGLVILDEPQALPKDWWDGIDRLLDLLTDEYGARVIAMTATQPSLLRNRQTSSLLDLGETHDAKECPNCRDLSYQTPLPPSSEAEYFKEAERVRYTIDETALSHQLERDDLFIGHEAAADRILKETADNGSTLAICNTINSSQTLTESVCDRSRTTHLGVAIEAVLESEGFDAIEGSSSTDQIVDRVLKFAGITRYSDQEDGDETSGNEEWDVASDVGTVVLTLNSRYRPFDREILIELADMLSTGPVPFVMISTQAIEAGVDLSFERVYRDIAPLDSIVQAAGRCNRSFEWGRNGGRVTIWSLAAPDEEKPSAPSKDPPAHYVYETGSTDAGIPGHLRLISDVLAEIPNLHDVPDVELSRYAVDDYFEALHQRKSLTNSDIREHIDDAKARWLGRQSLIDGYDTVDVLVAATDPEERELNRITELFVVGNPEAYERLESASSVRVSLPADIVEDSPDIVRIDGENRGEDGVQVFRYTGETGLEYSLDEGGLQAGSDGVAGRFTVI